MPTIDCKQDQCLSTTLLKRMNTNKKLSQAMQARTYAAHAVFRSFLCELGALCGQIPHRSHAYTRLYPPTRTKTTYPLARPFTLSTTLSIRRPGHRLLAVHLCYLCFSCSTSCSRLFTPFHGQSDSIRPQFFKNSMLRMAESSQTPSFPSRSSVQIRRFPVSRQFTGLHGQSDSIRPNFSKIRFSMAEFSQTPSFPSRSSVHIRRFPVSRCFTPFHGQSDSIRPIFQKFDSPWQDPRRPPSFPSRSSVQIRRFPVSRCFTPFHGQSDPVRLNFTSRISMNNWSFRRSQFLV